MTAPTAPTPAIPLKDRLGRVRVGLREDLEVTRHVFRGRPSYAVCDPMTGQSQRLDPEDYTVMVSLSADRSLATVFKDLTKRGLLAEDEEERFYQFVMSLHGIGFLRLPLSDHANLYRRYQAKVRSRRRQWLTGFLFLRIPLWNPNAFLERTLPLGRWLFSKAFFFCWLGLMALASYVAVRQWSSLTQPLEGVLVAGNLPVLWISLVVLKLFHEFGHAYACKHFGGHVPEMGAYLILFTPCAYVDATASWGFKRKRDRIIVCLAGMYVESIFAALATIVWAMTPPSALHSAAYNVMFLAGLVTVLFNVNPLMRYDGYYVLSDWLEIPNLRERAARYLTALGKRWLLGVTDGPSVESWRLKVILLAYGVGALIYRVALVLGISILLAGKFLLAGLLVGGIYLGTAVVQFIRKLMHYLWHHDETVPVRGRAMALGVFLFVVLPALALCVPLPRTTRAMGVLARQHEQVLRVTAPGVLQQAALMPGHSVAEGELVAELTNDLQWESVVIAESNLAAAQSRLEAQRILAPALALEEQARVEALIKAVEKAKNQLDELSIRAPRSGELVSTLTNTDHGRFLPEGFPVAQLVSGAWEVRALLTEEQWSRAAPRVGDSVEFCSAGHPSRRAKGTVQRIAPAASREVDHPSLTQFGGGVVVVDPSDRLTLQPMIEVTIKVDEADFPNLRYGMTTAVRFSARTETLAASLGRRLHVFWSKLGQG